MIEHIKPMYSRDVGDNFFNSLQWIWQILILWLNIPFSSKSFPPPYTHTGCWISPIPGSMFQISLLVSATILYPSVTHARPSSLMTHCHVTNLFCPLEAQSFTASKAVTSHFFSTSATYKQLPGLYHNLLLIILSKLELSLSPLQTQTLLYYHFKNHMTTEHSTLTTGYRSPWLLCFIRQPRIHDHPFRG